MKTCNYCFDKLESKFLGILHYCVNPKCPSFGIYQVPVQDLSEGGRCMVCHKLTDLNDLLETKENGEFGGYMCNKCLHRQIKLLSKKK